MSTTDVKTLDENYELLKATVTSCDIDYEKFTTRQVKVSATRIRARLLVIKKLCDAIRKQLLADLALIPVKTRTKKIPVIPPATPPTSEDESNTDDEKKDTETVGELPTEAEAIKYADKYAAVDLMGTKTVMMTPADAQKEATRIAEVASELAAAAATPVRKKPARNKKSKKSRRDRSTA